MSFENDITSAPVERFAFDPAHPGETLLPGRLPAIRICELSIFPQNCLAHV